MAPQEGDVANFNVNSLISGIRVSRRTFLKYCVGSVAVLVSACTNKSNDDESQSTFATEGPPGTFQIMAEEGQPVKAVEGQSITLEWTESARAQEYDVELNGVFVAEGLAVRWLKVGFSHAGIGFQEGGNSYRVRARNDVGEMWSDVAVFDVQVTGGIRARHFDHEIGPDVDSERL